MATVIPPQSFINAVVLKSITITYEPSFDGLAWVVDPANIKVNGIGVTVNDGAETSPTSAPVPFNDLPVGAQTAIQQLYAFMESEIADQY